MMEPVTGSRSFKFADYCEVYFTMHFLQRAYMDVLLKTLLHTNTTFSRSVWWRWKKILTINSSYMFVSKHTNTQTSFDLHPLFVIASRAPRRVVIAATHP